MRYPTLWPYQTREHDSWRAIANPLPPRTPSCAACFRLVPCAYSLAAVFALIAVTFMCWSRLLSVVHSPSTAQWAVILTRVSAVAIEYKLKQPDPADPRNMPVARLAIWNVPSPTFWISQRWSYSSVDGSSCRIGEPLAVATPRVCGVPVT